MNGVGAKSCFLYLQCCKTFGSCVWSTPFFLCGMTFMNWIVSDRLLGVELSWHVIFRCTTCTVDCEILCFWRNCTFLTRESCCLWSVLKAESTVSIRMFVFLVVYEPQWLFLLWCPAFFHAVTQVAEFGRGTIEFSLTGKMWAHALHNGVWHCGWVTACWHFTHETNSCKEEVTARSAMAKGADGPKKRNTWVGLSCRSLKWAWPPSVTEILMEFVDHVVQSSHDLFVWGSVSRVLLDSHWARWARQKVKFHYFVLQYSRLHPRCGPWERWWCYLTLACAWNFCSTPRTVARVRAVLFGDNSSPAEGAHGSSIVGSCPLEIWWTSMRFSGVLSLNRCVSSVLRALVRLDLTVVLVTVRSALRSSWYPQRRDLSLRDFTFSVETASHIAPIALL